MPELDYKRFTLSRIDSFINQIQLLTELDFPYKDSSKALEIISAHISKQREGIQNSILENDALQSRCARSTTQLFVFHRFLGYIRKSADPINSFEIYFSFRRLAETILGKETQLIISSEWESYSPVNFTIPPELINFVFIGLPVSEAENSLIVPLAGHELGHSIWTKSNTEIKYRSLLQREFERRTSFDNSDISNIVEISLIKCAEYFCDFIGIGLFGESYLYAFAYLIAPKFSKNLVASHPNATNRAMAMINAAENYGYTVPTNFKDQFKTQLDPHLTQYAKILEETERMSFQMTKTIMEDVKKLLLSKNVLYKTSQDFDKMKLELLSMVPTSSANSLADVTNAAWSIYFTEEKWKEQKLSDQQKIEVLNELAIKSFEILEIKQRLQEG